MSVSVETKKLRDLLSFIVDNRGRTCPTAEDGLPLIATNCVKNTSLYPVFENVRYVSDDTYTNWFRAHPEPGDLIFVLKGSPGRVCLTPDPVNFCIAQDMVALRADPDEVDPGYLFAALRSSLIQDAIGNLHVGSMIAHFKKGDFDRLEIPVPDRSTQEEVGQIYLLLSQKIEQNNRMAETLEEMARTLYRSWFVDFDPVKAKAEGLAPAFMDEATAALFPDRFGDNGLPDGWSLRSLGEFFKFQRGLSYKGKFLTETGAPMINLGCFKGDGGFDAAKIKNYSGETKERNWVRPGDLVFANTDMTQNRLILGSPHVVEGDSSEAFLYSHHVFAARPTTTDSRLWTRFIFFQLLQPEFRERAEGFATGTTVLFLPADAAEALSFAAPDLPLVKAFNDETDPWLERAKNLRAENQTLTALRDTLLPKLMSGELRVGEARDQIEEVA